MRHGDGIETFVIVIFSIAASPTSGSASRQLSCQKVGFYLSIFYDTIAPGNVFAIASKEFFICKYYKYRLVIV